MKRKYYMRGIGIGIIITCILFMIDIALGNPMSDEAVKRRARQLGMVDAQTASGDADSRTLKEIQDEEDKKDSSSTTKTTVTTDSKTGQKTTTTTTTKKHTPGSKPDDGKAEDDKEKQDNKKEKTDGTKKVTKTTKPADSKASITISSGDTSDDVGSKLERAGIVDSGSDFNHYLEQNGYDRTIHSGTYSFEKGSSYQSIAGAISH